MSNERIIGRRKTWWFAGLGVASFILLAAFTLWGMLLRVQPTPDSALGWAVLVVFVVPFYVLLGLIGEMVLEAIVGY